MSYVQTCMSDRRVRTMSNYSQRFLCLSTKLLSTIVRKVSEVCQLLPFLSLPLYLLPTLLIHVTLPKGSRKGGGLGPESPYYRYIEIMLISRITVRVLREIGSIKYKTNTAGRVLRYF